jgi:hypothetical protein
MSLNESMVEDAAFECFGEHARCARALIPALSRREKEGLGSIRRLKPANLSRAFATSRDTLLLQLARRELSEAKFIDSRMASA